MALTGNTPNNQTINITTANGTYGLSNTNIFTPATLSGTINTTITKPSSGMYSYKTTFSNTWKKFSLPNDNSLTEESEVIESPHNGKQVWIATMSLDNHYCKHHFNIFLKLYPDVKYNINRIFDNDRESDAISIYVNEYPSTTNILFYTETDFMIFETWFASYLSKFEDKNTLYFNFLPPLPNVIPKTYIAKISASLKILDISFWIASTCSNIVYYQNDILFFVDEEEYSIFKLKFM